VRLREESGGVARGRSNRRRDAVVTGKKKPKGSRGTPIRLRERGVQSKTKSLIGMNARLGSFQMDKRGSAERRVDGMARRQ
jgi:hypothetical protein